MKHKRCANHRCVDGKVPVGEGESLAICGFCIIECQRDDLAHLRAENERLRAENARLRAAAEFARFRAALDGEPAADDEPPVIDAGIVAPYPINVEVTEPAAVDPTLEPAPAIWLRSESHLNPIEVLVQWPNSDWVLVIAERGDGPISHIVGPSLVAAAVGGEKP